MDYVDSDFNEHAVAICKVSCSVPCYVRYDRGSMQNLDCVVRALFEIRNDMDRIYFFNVNEVCYVW